MNITGNGFAKGLSFNQAERGPISSNYYHRNYGCHSSNDPNLRLKHPGVPDGSDGSDGTLYTLTENYTLPIAQVTVGIAYVPPLLCGDVYASSERHMCYTLRRGCSYAEAVFQASIRP